MTKETPEHKAWRKAGQRRGDIEQRAAGTQRRAGERQADLNNGGKSLLRRLLGG